MISVFGLLIFGNRFNLRSDVHTWSPEATRNRSPLHPLGAASIKVYATAWLSWPQCDTPFARWREHSLPVWYCEDFPTNLVHWQGA